jgi:hypothetical protein
VDLERLLQARGVDTEGAFAVCAGDRFPNAILWMGLSPQAAGILTAVVDNPEVDAVATSPVVYLTQGRVPLLPVGEVRWLHQYRQPT